MYNIILSLILKPAIRLNIIIQNHITFPTIDAIHIIYTGGKAQIRMFHIKYLWNLYISHEFKYQKLRI